MKPVVIALASNERYFPGLYCAVASALIHLAPARKVDVKVLDGGLSQSSRDNLSRLINRMRKRAGLEFVTVDPSIFANATLGPGHSYMAYCRMLLPRLLHVQRLIYLDCDVLALRDVSELFDLELPPGKAIAAVPDSETVSLGQDSPVIADGMQLSSADTYFNSGVMLLDLNALRQDNFPEHAFEFLERWKGHYRFHEQSVFNFLLHDRIAELPEYWNRPSWRFDEQANNDLGCVLHYTRSAPWLGGTAGPAQVLFERFASQAGFPLNQQVARRGRQRQHLIRNALAPVRAAAFPIASWFYKIIGQKQKSAAYRKAARYWRDYIRNAPRRHRLHHRRAKELQDMTFRFGASESAA